MRAAVTNADGRYSIVDLRPGIVGDPRLRAERAARDAIRRFNQIFETACYEGNYALIGILAGVRAIEKEQAAKQKSR